MEWLHFIGKSYYTIPEFEEEAEDYGVSRRIALNMLSGIYWGDRIWLAQGDMKKKNRVSPFFGSVIFGSFRVTQLGGLDSWSIDALKEEFKLEDVSLVKATQGKVVKRNCGIYLIDKTYKTSASLAEIAQFLRDSTEQVGVLLLQGQYKPLQPRAFLPDISFRWGYRHFDEEKFLAAYNQVTNETQEGLYNKVVVIPGEFKSVETLPRKSTAIEEKTIESVLEYTQADPYHPLNQGMKQKRKRK